MRLPYHFDESGGEPDRAAECDFVSDVATAMAYEREEAEAMKFFRLNLTNLLLAFAMSCPPVYAEDHLFQIVILAPADPDAERGLIYADAQSHLVMEYDLGRVENDKVYFFDGRPLYNLTDAESYNLANTPYFLGNFAKMHQLTQLEIIFGRAIFGSNTLDMRSIDTPQCQWPYNTDLNIKRSDDTVDVMFFRRRDVPKRDLYQIWCERGPGQTELETNFDNLPLTIFVDPSRRPLIAFRKPPVLFRFNSDGATIAVRDAAGIFAVPASSVKRLFSMVTEGEIQPQAPINMLDAELDLADRDGASR